MELNYTRKSDYSRWHNDEEGYFQVVRENWELKRQIQGLKQQIDKDKNSVESDKRYEDDCRTIERDLIKEKGRRQIKEDNLRNCMLAETRSDKYNNSYGMNYHYSRSIDEPSQESKLKCHPLRNHYADKESSYTNLRSIIPTSDTYQFHSKSKYLLPTSHYLSQTSSNFPSPSNVPQSLAFSPISDSSLESPQKPIQYDIEDQELKQRISSLKESIKQIEVRQEQLLGRIDRKISKRELHSETQQINQKPAQELRPELSQQQRLDKKFEQTQGQRNEQRTDYRQEKIQEIKDKIVEERNKKEDEKFEEKTQIRLEGRSRMPNRRVRGIREFYDQEILEDQLQQDNQYQEERDGEREDEREREWEIKRNDFIGQKIFDRNRNVMQSRSNRSPTRLSPSRSNNSSISRSPLFSSDKLYNKYEMVNDSFGSPDLKEVKAKMVNHTCDEDKYCPCFTCNDPIIKNLQSQEHMLENYIPLSRIEPVPVSMSTTELAITYNSSPNRISYQYEKSGSPPRLNQTRKKLFSSPTHKREVKEDKDPGYACNADCMSSMRANDLHCGRGSSPLRTRLKSSPSNKNRSKSPKNAKTKVYYCVEEGLINIKTPAKKNYDEDSYDNSSPKTKLINDLQDSNRDLHTFQRRCKASNQNTDLKSRIDTDLYREDICQFQPNPQKTKFEVKSFSKSPNKSKNFYPQTTCNSVEFLRKSKERYIRILDILNRSNEKCYSGCKSNTSSVIQKSPNSRNQSESKSRSYVDKNIITEDDRILKVQRRKEELFQKRQNELKMKLQKKEAKRQFLCSTKRSYTPKRGFDQPNTPTNIMTQQDDTCQKQEWQI